MKLSRLIIAGIGGLALAALLYYFYGGSAAPSGQPPLVSLEAGNLDPLGKEFNSARGMVRIIALLSPT